ncbi:DUF3619 family protein [Polynucleobacter sp. CS-Odin-A6]|uniref:DUF3619 family protein n=1 Tax=Polynucleobacter sp. CS-Odin-A6 TaxID=2689106 RepID=UPI001C0CA7BB|nr:DUF3619 family protein [Polynucleobacter sp. CS-Odin-A6]
MNRKNEELLNPTEADQFGRATAALLRDGSQSLSAVVKDRLYSARLKALSVQKPEKIAVYQPVLAFSAGNRSFGSRSFWDNLGWVAPLVVLVFGLIGIAQWQQDSRINDIAELDVALLTDEVPPDAYADSGFMGFLKNGALSDSNQDSSDTAKLPS